MENFNEREVVIFFDILHKHNVEYLIIGGVAVNIHGYTRATGDLDVWYNPTKDNFLRLLEAIKVFGFDVQELSQVTEYENKGFVRLPLDHFYIELMAIIDGKMKFNEVYTRAFKFDLEGIEVNVIGYDDLIQNKIMSRRFKDLEDVKQLERIREARKSKNP